MKRSQVVDLYAEGVNAIGEITAGFDSSDWQRRVSGEWTADQTARHLVALTSSHQEWLDRALAGNSTIPMTPEEHFDSGMAAVADLADLDGPAAIARYRSSALDYLDRAQRHWQQPYGSPLGTTTVGLHLGAAAIEWHFRAWDFSTITSALHSPSDHKALFVASGRCLAATQPFVAGIVLRLVVSRSARRSSWESILKKAGRG